MRPVTLDGSPRACLCGGDAWSGSRSAGLAVRGGLRRSATAEGRAGARGRGWGLGCDRASLRRCGARGRDGGATGFVREGVAPGGARENVEPGGARENVMPGGAQANVVPGGARENVMPVGARKEVMPSGAQQNCAPCDVRERVAPGGAKRFRAEGRGMAGLLPGASLSNDAPPYRPSLLGGSVNFPLTPDGLQSAFDTMSQPHGCGTGRQTGRQIGRATGRLPARRPIGMGSAGRRTACTTGGAPWR